MENKNTICGSRLYSKTEVFKEEVGQFAVSTKAIVNNNKLSLCERHNAYTAYCLIAINYDSGHRPVRDPMAYREDVDLDNGWLLINDKSSSKATETRVVPISDGSVSIFKAYLNHLQGLACELAEKYEMPELASAVATLVEPQHYAKQSLPLFFFLSENNNVVSVSPGSLKRVIRNRWRYELNHNRHFLETNLSRNGLSSLLVDCHVGHQHGISHPLGLNSNLTHEEYTEKVKPLLNCYFKDYGWEVIHGFEGSDAPISLMKKQSRSKRYGQYERRSRRNRLGSFIKDEAMGVALQYADHYGVENICKEEGLQKRAVEQLLSEIKIAKHYKRKAIAALSASFIEIARDAGLALKVKISPMVLEESPFNDRWVVKYKQGENLKNNFIQEITSKKFQPRTLEEGWAYVVASAVCVGGLYNEEWSRCLLLAGPSAVKKMMNWVMYVDIWTDSKRSKKQMGKSPDWRWHPDSVSKAIIMTLAEQYDGLDKKGFSYSRCIQHFNKITERIGLNVTGSREPLSVLCRELRWYWLRYLPAYIRKVMDGDIKTTPMPEVSMARLCYRRRISQDQINEDVVKEVVIKEGGNSKPASVSEYLYSVGLAMAEAEKRDQAKRGIQLQNLRSKLLLLHEQHKFPEICRALSQWLVHITVHGTPRKEKPSIHTIIRYFQSIANPLCLLLYRENLADLSEERLTDVYKHVVEYNDTDSVMRNLALRQFNEVISVYGLIEEEELDWRYIGESLKDTEIRKPDANIVTEIEVLQAINAINKSTENTYIRHIVSIAISICYRFGLRISELSRLRIQDVQVDGKNIVLQLVPTEFGKLKSYSGVRQIPLVGEMSDVEIRIFKKQLEVAAEFQEKGNNSLLLFNPYAPGEPVDIEWLRRYMHKTLRHICGDQEIRVRHLRHSYITSLYYALASAGGRYIAKILCQSRAELINNIVEKFNIQENETMPMAILSLLAGHASILTSIHTYSHLVDDAITSYVDRVDIKGLGIHDAANLLCQKVNTLKNRANKYSLNKSTNVAHSILKSIRPSQKIPNYVAKLEKWPQMIPVEYEPRKLDLRDLNRILVMYGVNNHDISYISHYTGFDEEVLHKAIKSASVITNSISVQIYGDVEKRDNYWVEEVKNENNIVRYEASRYGALLDILHVHINASAYRNSLQGMVSAWGKSILSLDRGLTLRFRTPEMMESFLSGIEMLGYRKDDFYARYSQSLNEKQASAIKKKLGEIGVFDVHADSVRRLEGGESLERLSFVDVNFKRTCRNSGLPTSIKALSNAMFLAGTMIHFESHL